MDARDGKLDDRRCNVKFLHGNGGTIANID
jgi:hypothetical protein